jgi:hypothetical protein
MAFVAFVRLDGSRAKFLSDVWVTTIEILFGSKSLNNLQKLAVKEADACSSHAAAATGRKAIKMCVRVGSRYNIFRAES